MMTDTKLIKDKAANVGSGLIELRDMLFANGQTKAAAEVDVMIVKFEDFYYKFKKFDGVPK